ncbi:phenylacetate--CoA ligase family protein [Sphingobacterium sp. JB170]|uniref:phenylacetate--CoA ligase family protein n=1 Tax=Sphingobacterium sp. JB170 TaxID=1434842 RepID=UPI00097F380B|nr:AMP-binding protein [Sphingobacterium sp. JB170]SJN44248.1 Phenylacetate-coenzyme A ligase [Sphingobacterium sp. JB170]
MEGKIVMERQPPFEIKAYQEELLRRQLLYLSEHSPYYCRVFEKHGIDIKTINTIEDLLRIPTTSKDDVQQFNADFFCTPKSEIIDYCSTSGTLGKPVTFGLTEADLERLAYNEMRSFRRIGVQKGDIVQLMTTLDRRFMAGLAYFLGLRKLGAGVLRVGSGIPQMQWDSILQHAPRFLIAVPSFLLKMIEYAEKQQIDYRGSSVEAVLCIGESLRDASFKDNMLAQRIKEKWPIELFSTYASTEMGSAFTECEAFMGGHLHEDLIITEVLDEDERPVEEGQPGELVVTPLGIQGVPLLRFKTGDIVRRHSEPCACGCESYRIGPVEGRKQHMIKYKGTTLFPPAMHDLLTGFPDLEHHLIEISQNDIGTDEIMIFVSARQPSERMLQQIKDLFRAKLRVAPSVEWRSAEDLQKVIFDSMSRKPITFIDRRKMNC